MTKGVKDGFWFYNKFAMPVYTQLVCQNNKDMPTDRDLLSFRFWVNYDVCRHVSHRFFEIYKI